MEPAVDDIDMPTAAWAEYRASNYREAPTYATSIEQARTHVEVTPDLRDAQHVFLYNPEKVTSYLVSDLDRDRSFETGVCISKFDNSPMSASDMGYWDII